MSGKWQGGVDGDRWAVEIEADCFSEDEPFVVSILASSEDEDGKAETMPTPSAEQAREMAAALLRAADAADAANRRVAQWKAGHR